MLAGLQQALAGKLFAAETAGMPVRRHQVDDELAGEQHDSEVTGVARRKYELTGRVPERIVTRIHWRKRADVRVQLANGFQLVDVGV